MKSEQLKHDQQEKRCRSFHKNFDLNVTAQDPEQEPDLQCELIQNHYSQYCELSEKTDKHVYMHSTETNKHEEHVPQEKTSEGCVDRLLIVGQSAEIVTAQSEDSLVVTHAKNQHKDQENSLLDRLSSDSHVRSERCEPCYKVTGTRLSEIRKQARCKYLISDQDTAEDNQCKHLQRKTIRLSQMKQQARCKSKNNWSPSQMITRHSNELQQGRKIRLSQMKHQARSKNNATVKEGTEEHTCVNQHCNRYRARQDNENHKERKCASRRLRSFKTKDLRQQLTTECVRTSADTRLHASDKLLKDKDLITCEQELPETSGCTENLESNFGASELQGHHGSKESSGLRCKSHQHISNGLPVQNNVLFFTGLPNYTYQQCDPNMGWVLYMHHAQLKEYRRVVARQHRAERIEEKRALKYKQKSKNRILANSEAQKENLPVKKLRLTQLRREVRIGNQRSLMQGTNEN
ncbi:uncharacterized protein LOC123905022 isoform X2 [Trifolium pratense]|uniref:Uncharacterized protein n=1 Tax=Trifolium pratense TaxID=57577 RepID=A0ACB0JVU5_TRIPR|nr:uncharacterized protein LOC123905022 isoform X2 [Trifolium pratense]CAJ2647969.1 unnamed protein product [Trifolium pratense]